MNVAKDNVDGAHAQPLRQLVEIHDAHIGGEGNVDPLAHPAHRLVPPAGVLIIFDIERFDQLADANRGLRRQDGVGIVAQLLGQGSQSAAPAELPLPALAEERRL